MQKDSISHILYNFPLSKKLILQGVKIFILFSFLGIIGVYLLSEKGIANIQLQVIRVPFFLLVILLTGCDYILGACRIYYMTWVLGKRIRFKEAIKTELCSIFLSTVTPLQTGGGPAQLYILYQAGLKVGEAMAISFMNFIFTVLFIYTISGLVIAFGYDSLGIGMLANLFSFSVLFFFFLIVFGIVLYFKPLFGTWIIHILKTVIHLVLPNHGNWIDRIYDSLINHLKIWWINFSYFFKEKKLFLLGGFSITVIIFMNKYTMSYCVIRGLGLNVEYIEVLSLMVILNALLYFTPTPGASGIAEITTAVFMKSLIPGEYTVTYTIIWLFFASYLGATIGGIILFKTIFASLDSIRDRTKNSP